MHGRVCMRKTFNQGAILKLQLLPVNLTPRDIPSGRTLKVVADKNCFFALIKMLTGIFCGKNGLRLEYIISSIRIMPDP